MSTTTPDDPRLSTMPLPQTRRGVWIELRGGPRRWPAVIERTIDFAKERRIEAAHILSERLCGGPRP